MLFSFLIGKDAGQTGSEGELEASLDARLAQEWGTRSKAIVISPEVDLWIWGSDNALETQMAWSDPIHLRPWLLENGFNFNGDGKPDRPKEALGRALRLARLPRSSALYEQTALVSSSAAILHLSACGVSCKIGFQP